MLDLIKTSIVRIDSSSGKAENLEDYVAEEKPLHIIINNTQYATIFCSPNALKELALGHLLSEGIIKSIGEINAISLEENNICRIRLKPNVSVKARLRLSGFSRIILSACGGAYQPTVLKRIKRIKSNLRVEAQTIQKSVNNLNYMAETFRK
ncbi:formate dehydrogenase accessory sulfurtransferase FdhD, partial [Candidatus Bathyarchaeota archaeon]|nr:formate dehydrogenase accessory sulfurtransferase FdhD [Candidatus Bathyarchaeota archaeon]